MYFTIVLCVPEYFFSRIVQQLFCTCLNPMIWGVGMGIFFNLLCLSASFLFKDSTTIYFVNEADGILIFPEIDFLLKDSII